MTVRDVLAVISNAAIRIVISSTNRNEPRWITYEDEATSCRFRELKLSLPDSVLDSTVTDITFADGRIQMSCKVNEDVFLARIKQIERSMLYD